MASNKTKRLREKVATLEMAGTVLASIAENVYYNIPWEEISETEGLYTAWRDFHHNQRLIEESKRQMDAFAGARKQTTRLLKVECEACGYIMRVSKTCLALGVPNCPNHQCTQHGDRMACEDEATTADERVNMIHRRAKNYIGNVMKEESGVEYQQRQQTHGKYVVDGKSQRQKKEELKKEKETLGYTVRQVERKSHDNDGQKGAFDGMKDDLPF